MHLYIRFSLQISCNVFAEVTPEHSLGPPWVAVCWVKWLYFPLVFFSEALDKTVVNFEFTLWYLEILVITVMLGK